MQAFEIMASVVSFDYFDVFEHWNVGFTPTDPFRVNFEWLGYETLNFLEGMGSITILILLGVVYIFAMFILRIFGCNRRSKTLETISAPMGIFHKTLGFVQGTFFEISLCASVGMKMLYMLEYLNKADKVAIGFQMVAAFILLSFIVFVLYFTLVEGPTMIDFDLYKEWKHHEKKIEQVKNKFKSQYKARSDHVLKSE